MNTQSLNPPSTPLTHLPSHGQSELRIQRACLPVSRHYDQASDPTIPSGHRRWDRGPSVPSKSGESKQQSTPDATEKLT